MRGGRLGPRAAIAIAIATGCGQERAGAGDDPSPSAAAVGSTTAAHAIPSDAAAASAAPSAGPSASAAPSAAAPAPCPDDMVLAEGGFCPDVLEKCLRHTREWDDAQKEPPKDGPSVTGGSRSPHVSERCLEYAPTKCLSKERRPMRFCVDKHEWPNQPGEKPAFMVTWGFAKDACEKVGKRLCTADEFTFACEGEEILPYAYGLVRDKDKCNIDKPYVQPRFRLQPYDVCLTIPTCKAHMEELDQRAPIGARPACGSPFGAFDINGNVNEWVDIPGQKAPWRSGLKGGWWGPSRSRCRPMVTAHNENYVGYEVGFRCCKAAGGTKP